MKRSAIIAVFSLALVLCCSRALAVDFAERAYYSIYEMRSSSTMYSYTEGDGSNGLPYDYTPIGTLPAGTPVSSLGKVYGNYQHISYIDGDDHWAHVAVDKGTVKSAFTILDVGIGYTVKIPVAAARAGAEVVFDYVSWRYGVDPNIYDVRRGLRGGSSAQPTATPEPITESFYSVVKENGALELVKLVSLGLTESVVSDSTGEHSVATSDLLFQTNAPAHQRVAWLVSNTGKVNMRRQPGSEGRVTKSCSAGLMVTVFDLGEKYTGIICEGQEGYVLTSSLGFPASLSLSAVALTSYQGSTDDSRHKINLRAKASGSSRRLAQFGCGVPAEVLLTEGDWSEVILEGWHGYIQNGFLQMHLPPIPVLITPEAPVNAELNEKLWSYLETVWLPTRTSGAETMGREEIQAFLSQMQAAGFAFPQGFLSMMTGDDSAPERSVSYVLTQTCYTQLGDYLHFTVADQYRLYQLMRQAGVAAYQNAEAQHPALPPADSPSQADVMADCRTALSQQLGLTEEQLDRMHVLIRFNDGPGLAANERVLAWQLDWLDAEGDTAFQPRYRCTLVVGGGSWQLVRLMNQ